jgi:predicted  nucleic acid-binding Zn-ribbon protein
MNTKKNIKQELSSLIKMQELDAKISGLKREKDTLISSLSELDASIQKAKHAQLASLHAVEKLEKIRSQVSGFRDLNRLRFSAISVEIKESKNQETFQARKREAEELDQLEKSLAERIQKCTTDIEVAKKDLEVLTKEVSALVEERNTRASSLSERANGINVNIVSLQAERNLASVQVTSRSLAQYERILLNKGTSPVVLATQGLCHGCNMIMPAQNFSELLRATEMQFCPRCNRIVYSL